MLEDQIDKLASLMKDEDLKKYAGEGFWDLMQAVIFSDPVSAIGATKNAIELAVHMPTYLFWDKMRRYLTGTFYCFEDQVKMAAKFNGDNKEYNKFVKRLIQLLDQLDDDQKVDYFAALTRAFLLTDLDRYLFFKLSKYLDICIPEELEFIRELPYDYRSDNTAMISSLYQYGLFTVQSSTERYANFVLSDYGRALKQNCLNFDESLNDKRIVTYDDIAPLVIPEAISDEEFSEMLDNDFQAAN